MSERTQRWCVRGALALPFVVALIALAARHWTPVLDLAMTEFRVRDVGGRHTPLIGLPGRIGKFPEQGSHPGPLSFYLLAPIYRVFASHAYGLLVGAVIVNLTAVLTALWVAGRRGGLRMVLATGALLATVLAWLGASVLTQPWNPYLPLASFVVVVLSGWAVLDGDHRMLIVQVIAATLCAQTHVPYLSLSVALIALSFGAIGRRWWKARSVDRPSAISAGVAVGVAALLWLPPFVDQWRRDPGNITMLRRHFLDPPEQPQGLGVGVKTILRHFDVFHLVATLAGRSGNWLDTLRDLEGGSWVVGLVVLLAWAATAVWSLRLPDRRVRRLHLVVAVATFVAVMSTARIFGKVWYYLTLWAWVIALVAVFAALFTVWVGIGPERRSKVPAVALLWVVIGLSTTAFVVDAARVEPPEQRLGEVLADVLGPTVQAIDDGTGAAVGPDGTYAVAWADAYYFGSQGYGLISELERQGIDARAYPTYRVPVTPQRTATVDQVDAEIILATGVNVDRWRGIEGAVEVATVEPRTPEQLDRYQQLRADAIAGLHDAGLADLEPLVDTNLFGLSLDQRLPPKVQRMLADMLVLGQETAVFIAPPGTFDANP